MTLNVATSKKPSQSCAQKASRHKMDQMSSLFFEFFVLYCLCKCKSVYIDLPSNYFVLNLLLCTARKINFAVGLMT